MSEKFVISKKTVELVASALTQTIEGKAAVAFAQDLIQLNQAKKEPEDNVEVVHD